MPANPSPGREPGPVQARVEALRVLIVDDSDVYRSVVAEAIRALGHEVVGEAADGVSGVAAALELDPDVVVMDWQMPRMNGVSATAAIRDRRPAIGVIGHSVVADEQVERGFARAGASACVPKGDMAALRAALQRGGNHNRQRPLSG